MSRLGPASGLLLVRTARRGPAAFAGHDLELEVGAWEAELTDGAVTLTADPRSLTVRDGQGGIKALGAPEKAAIRRTIDRRVLRGRPISFRSTAVAPGGPGGALVVDGELTLHGVTRPLRAYVDVHGDGRHGAVVRLRQSDFGIRPYGIGFGALRVADEVEVVIHAKVAPPA